jgi:hypothetical protein
MFKVHVISNLMVWHSFNRSIDGLVQHVADSKAWSHIDVTWVEFATKPHNVRLGLATNGVNPYGDKSYSRSMWLVLLFNYNLPPWLVTKKLFVMLALIILGKEFVKMQNIDVYMALLIKELQVLWKGVAAYDVAKHGGQRHFTLSAILMWTIHDYSTYGLMVGCAHQGYKSLSNLWARFD